MKGPSDAIGTRFVDERRLTDILIPGIVTAVDRTVIPWKLKIAGRWMPFIEETIEEGDKVIWVNIDDPFAWVRVVVEDIIGDVDWTPDSPANGFHDIAHIFNFFGAVTSRNYTITYPSTPTDQKDLVIQLASIRAIVTDSSGTFTTEHFRNVASGGSNASLWSKIVTRTGIGTTTQPVSAVSWDTPHRDFHWATLMIPKISAVHSMQVTDGGTTFPVANAPGAGWPVIYIIISESGDYPEGTNGSFTLDPAITRLFPAIFGDFALDMAGDSDISWELSTAAGDLPARTVTTSGQAVRLVTMVLDPRQP